MHQLESEKSTLISESEFSKSSLKEQKQSFLSKIAELEHQVKLLTGQNQTVEQQPAPIQVSKNLDELKKETEKRNLKDNVGKVSKA